MPTGGSASTFLRGDGAWVTPGGSYAFWTLTADSGSNQNILNGNTVDIAGGTGISTVVGATDTVTLTLDNTAVVNVPPVMSTKVPEDVATEVTVPTY